MFKKTNSGITTVGFSDFSPSYPTIDTNYAYPNPTTTITYQLPSEGLVRLYVFDSLGNTVLRLVNKQQAAGKYSIEFDATNIPSGVYYYRIESGNYSDTKKMILLK
ncbi:MAG: T9SS type A sorting domain-containing protein [Melioribacteraceae bacterium]|nr:T9SS type A sorting domain-containing protein [Melioribacteraceae bacterium]MDD3557627.1 T9SS type A sorting domain-containing protein [Melioribacteraceae bacterium]